MNTATVASVIETTSPDFVRWVYDAFDFVTHPTDLEREIAITGYDGHYGPSGYIITINGSPTRGTVVIDREDVLLKAGGRTRLRHRYRPDHFAKWNAVFEFLKQHGAEVGFLE